MCDPLLDFGGVLASSLSSPLCAPGPGAAAALLRRRGRCVDPMLCRRADAGGAVIYELIVGCRDAWPAEEVRAGALRSSLQGTAAALDALHRVGGRPSSAARGRQMDRLAARRRAQLERIDRLTRKSHGPAMLGQTDAARADCRPPPPRPKRAGVARSGEADNNNAASSASPVPRCYCGHYHPSC